jgi:arylsulfatase A-like enzyme
MHAIVFLVDTVRRDHVGCYGNPWIETPGLDRLAASGTLFENAYLGSYPCMPARRDLWTGRYEFPWRGWGPLEEGDPDVVRLVGAAGVTTMLITDHYHLWERGSGNYHHAFDGFEFIRGNENDAWITDPTIPIVYPASPAKLAGHTHRSGSVERYLRNTAHFRREEDYFAPQVMRCAMDWLEANRTLERFLLVIDCFDPHEPFDSPAPYRDRYNPGYAGERVIWPTYGPADSLSPEELRDVRALYAGKLTMVDRWLGLVLDKLEALGLAEETLLLFATDHGHLLGEHNVLGKPAVSLYDSNMYQELAHIPLLIRHPAGAGVGQRLGELVQTVDLFPTLLEWFGADVPAGTHGRSLLPLVEGRQAAADGWRAHACYARFGEAVNVTDGEWTLFRWPPDGANGPLFWYSVEPPRFAAPAHGPLQDNARYPVTMPRGASRTALYNVRDDPGQTRDRYADEPDVASRLERALTGFLTDLDAPREQLTRLGLAD